MIGLFQLPLLPFETQELTGSRGSKEIRVVPSIGFNYITRLPGVFPRERASAWLLTNLMVLEPAVLSFYLHQEEVQGNVNNVYLFLKISVNTS